MTLGLPPLRFIASDLARGDLKSARLATEELGLIRIDSAKHPLFEEAYARLSDEFGSRNELEPKEVLTARLEWDPARPVNGCALLYQLVAVRHKGRIVALRDHSAIVPLDDPDAEAVVHLSHVLVEPEWRRTGLSGWLRALPIQGARECLRGAGLARIFPITLVAEMEHPRDGALETLIRLRAYEKGGFRKIDPAHVPYFQPDFRPPAVIDATGGPRPLPFLLVVRRIGREDVTHVSGAEVRRLAAALYRMFGVTSRAKDMAPLLKNLEAFPADDELIRLCPPTEPIPSDTSFA